MTSVLFSSGQKAALGLSWIAPAACWVGVYVYSALRPIPRERDLADHMAYLFSAGGGAYAGLVFGHIFSSAAIVQHTEIMWLLAGLGFLGTLLATRLHRVWGGNAWAHRRFIDADPARVLIDTDKGWQEDAAYAKLVDNEKIEDSGVLEAVDAREILRMRRLFALFVYGVYVFSMFIEGLYLMYNARGTSPAGLVAVLWFDRLAGGVAIASTFVYAGVEHAHRGGLLYWTGAVGWCAASVLSLIPAFSDISLDSVIAVVTHPATGAFYSAFGGALSGLVALYMLAGSENTDRKTEFVYAGISIVCFVLVWVLGFYL